MRLHVGMAFQRSRVIARAVVVAQQRTRRRRIAAALTAAGLVDVDFVRAQFGHDAGVVDAESAARAWASAEERLGYSPHPLVEPAWWRSRRTLGPLLEERPTATGIARAGRRVSALGLESPVPGSTMAWGAFRADAIARAEEFRTQNERSLRRPVPEWIPDPAAPRVAEGDLVTVVMPVRDRASVIGSAIASVVAQSYRNWELIVVDDGSTDGTADVVDEWALRDGRVRRLSHEPAGVSAARNRGIEAGSGRWIAFLDSDNQWRPEHLAACVAAIDEETAVHTAVRIRSADGVAYLAERTDRESLLDGRNAIDMNALVAPRAAIVGIGGFAEHLRRWVDYDLVLRLSETLRFRFVPVLGVEYDHRDEAADRITTRESPLWRQVVLARAVLDRSVMAARARSSRPGVATVVMRTRNQWDATRATMLHALALDHVANVVIIDAASYRAESAILRACSGADGRATILRSAVDWGRSLTVLAALAHARGRAIILLEPGSLPSPSRIREAIAEADGGIFVTPGADDGVLLVGDGRELALDDSLDLIEDPLAASEPDS